MVFIKQLKGKRLQANPTKPRTFILLKLLQEHFGLLICYSLQVQTWSISC